MTTVEQIAETVLYEGYLLWPYRRSAQKNQQRWTFGGVYPRRYVRSGDEGPDRLWWMQTECLLRVDDGSRLAVTPRVTVKVRFLHVVRRDVLRRLTDGSRVSVNRLQVGSQRYLAWDEAAERTVVCDLNPLTGGIANGSSSNCFQTRPYTARRHVPIDIPAGQLEEPLQGPDGNTMGWLLRSWEALKGSLDVEARLIRDGLYRLTARINNETPWQGAVGAVREPPSRQTFNSTHTILHVEHGAFISLMDPPPELAAEARACHNVKTWPVLAGEEGARDTMLSSPIILYDFPQVAPESPGNLFDSTEIDELLILNLLTLTDEEKEEIRATDPRARELLERSESLSGDDFMCLHGAIREFRTLRPPDAPGAASLTSQVPGTLLMDELEQPPPDHVLVDDVPVSPGTRVRLHPRAGGDIMDLALDQKIAIVQAIEQDYEGRVHLAVVLEDDPGRDLGFNRQPGHRFFFSPEEVEPLLDD